MNQASLQVLLVEDSQTDAQLFHHVFLRAATGNWTLVHAERLSEAIDHCQTQSFDLALVDLRLPDSEGLDTLSQLHQAVPDVPIIILTVFDDEELALQAMAQGAQDYLVKDQVTTQLLRRSIRYTIERSQILQKLKNSERATLAALDKERELNQLKSYFISMVSHEFRNPLSVLQSIGELLLRYEGSIPSTKKANYARHMHEAIAHMCQLLDEIILLGKVETGNFKTELRTLNLKDFCDELIEEFVFRKNNQHSVITSYEADLENLKLDSNLLRHILTNLISNAIKYSPSNKEIQFKVSYKNEQVAIEISDRGIGIPDGELHRLFKTFSRCSNVGKIQGTGLGLAIVQHCIDLCGGVIEVESQLGVGTKFTVLLPVDYSSNEGIGGRNKERGGSEPSDS